MRVTSGPLGVWAITTTPAFERTDANEPFLSIIDTVIYKGDAAPGQNPRSIGEVESVFGDIAAVLGFVPFVAHYIV
ncbi:MAG TPA: hypothetical protein VJ728_08800 [Candidatus Binataceae bacterium]|nr:hypothetical protein [Candidatus Binataceae bacterium]